VATGVCTEVDHIEVIESVDCRGVRSPDYVFNLLGFGTEPDSINPNDPAWGPSSSLNGMYAEVRSTMAVRLGMPLERVDTEHRVFPASTDLQTGAGVMPQGRVSHVNWRWHGIVEGSPRLTMSIHWYMEAAHMDDPHPPLWRIHVQGHPVCASRSTWRSGQRTRHRRRPSRLQSPARSSMRFPSYVQPLQAS
jgi:hypothetical protein